MRRELLIKVLEVTERAYPTVRTEEIASKLGLGLQNEEFLQIVNYLIDSKKVEVINKNFLPVMMNGAEELKVLHTGIDLLTELKTIQQKDIIEKSQHRASLSVTYATIVLALAAFIEVGVSIILNTKELLINLGTNLFTIIISGFFILFCFMVYLVIKSYKITH